MHGRLGRRLGSILLVLIAIFFATKGLLRLLPGDPVDVILAETGANLDPESLRKELGLDQGFIPATLSQLLSVLRHFDWGQSISQKRDIGLIIRERVANSGILAAASLSLALSFSILFSILANLPHRFNAEARRALTAFAALSTALPTAWIGPMLALLFAVKLGWFELSGGLALPTLTLALGISGFWVRAISETLARQLRSDGVRAARAKGLSEIRVAWKYALFPAAGPLLAYLGTQSGALFAGAVITETLFDRPGLGSLLVESIFKRDYPLAEAVLIFSSSLILFGNLSGDLLQLLVTPKLRDAEMKS